MNNQWRIWLRQTWTIFIAEFRKNLLTKRGIWIWLLALAPVALAWAHTIVYLKYGRMNCTIPRDTNGLSMIYQYFLLRSGIFFGCVGIFTRLFRTEMLERSLHYYFLSPVRREVLLLGKFLAGMATALLFFGSSTLLTFAGMYGHYTQPVLEEFLWKNHGVEHLLGYLGVTAFACLGYGAVFLAMGMTFRNPVVPAISVILWESINFMLPAWLKKCSVIFYLKAMTPVELPMDKVRGPLALLNINADAPPTWLAVTGLICFTAIIMAFASWQVRRMEISYAGD